MTSAPVEATQGDEATRDLPELSWTDLQSFRMLRYRRYAEGRLRSEEQARRFIDETGFCFLFPAPGVEMPSLWEAINGRAREIPRRHFDSALSQLWHWKDSLPAKKWVWYGKLMRGKPMFVALDELPFFYALSENFGEVDDYLQQFADGKMSLEARKVYEALLENGPSATSTLRRLSGLAGGGEPARRFERAIAELQVDFKIVKCGTADLNRWKYCYVYDVLLRWYPGLAERARAITTREARHRIITRYLGNVGAVDRARLPGLFGWDATLTERATEELLATGSLRQVRLTGAPPHAKKPGSKSVPAGPAVLLATVDGLQAG